MSFCLISIHYNNISDNNRSNWPIIRKLKSVLIGHGYQADVIGSSDLKALAIALSISISAADITFSAKLQAQGSGLVILNLTRLLEI